jgi:hypothetical protein
MPLPPTKTLECHNFRDDAAPLPLDAITYSIPIAGPMKSLLENFAAILGAATLVLLLMSVSHEYGYFWAVGRFFQTFLTTSDYFSNAVLWLPVTVVILYFMLDWNVLLGRRQPTTLGLKNRKAFWNTVLMAASIAFFFAVAVSAPYTGVYAFLIPGIVLWTMYGSRLLSFADANLEIQARRILFATPVVMAALFGLGFAHGQYDLASFNEPYTLEMKKGENLHRIALRAFDKGILVRDPVERRIEFVKWDDVTKISRLSSPSLQPLSCSLIRINCPDVPIP